MKLPRGVWEGSLTVYKEAELSPKAASALHWPDPGQRRITCAGCLPVPGAALPGSQSQQPWNTGILSSRKTRRETQK